MNEQQYEQIAAACDALLRAPGTSYARVAIPLLHVVSEHPSHTARYAPLLADAPRVTPSPHPAPAARGGTARRAARALAAALRPGAQRESDMQTLVRAAAPVDVLIVSRLTRAAQLQQPEDFYFGSLRRYLAQLGASSVVAYVDHAAPQNAPATPVSEGRLLLSRRVAVHEELWLWQQCLRASRALQHLAERDLPPLERAAARLAAAQVRSGAALENLRLHGVIARLCRRLRPRIVITTYEGDASERMIWHAARADRRQPLCVGYQHTMLFKRAHAIRRRVSAAGINCDPDVILTLGEITQVALEASPGLNPVRLLLYGSHRRVEPGNFSPGSARPARCLVLPDAHRDECGLLFAFAVDCAQALPGVTFVLRPHPATELIVPGQPSPLPPQLPVNVIISTGRSLAEECATSRYCLYRGSSAVLQTVRAGLRPFYVARAGELSFDPLWELAGWRETVTTAAQLAAHIASGDDANSQAAAAARRYCDRYVAPVRPAALEELLALAASR
jgi:hypothetical protein